MPLHSSHRVTVFHKNNYPVITAVMKDPEGHLTKLTDALKVFQESSDSSNHLHEENIPSVGQ